MYKKKLSTLFGVENQILIFKYLSWNSHSCYYLFILCC